jgi:DNA invertase Pin-like site-specific DNA recombinase
MIDHNVEGVKFKTNDDGRTYLVHPSSIQKLEDLYTESRKATEEAVEYMDCPFRWFLASEANGKANKLRKEFNKLLEASLV